MRLSLGQLPLVVPKRMEDWQHLFLLGAEDPEMDEIEKILVENGKTFQYAQYKGKRVEPWSAYLADPLSVPSATIIVLIECEPIRFKGHAAIIRIIDHHRPGDEGYDLSSEFFWRASSIGQLYTLLGLGNPTREHLLLAAMDHCESQARLGNCPGIEIEEVKDLGIGLTARRKGLDIMHVKEIVGIMRAKLLSSPFITIGTQKVFDLTSSSIGIGYSADYLCLQEAIVELGIVAIISTKNRIEGPEKIVVCGAATPETVRCFMESWAPAQGLIDIYGVPVRGYAGGYRE